jgi:hypothetical protein
LTTGHPKPSAFDSGRALLRHAVATLAYRGGKVLRDAPAGFSTFTAGAECRSAGFILAHMCDLLDWSLSTASAQPITRNSKPESWDHDVSRFQAALAALDAYLASDSPLHAPAQNLFQGPIADDLTHVGQLAMMRRLAGSPIEDENYFVAEIQAVHAE